MELLRVGSMAWETFVQQQHNMLTRVRASNSLLIRDKARLTDQNATLSRTVEQVKHTLLHTLMHASVACVAVVLIAPSAVYHELIGACACIIELLPLMLLALCCSCSVQYVISSKLQARALAWHHCQHVLSTHNSLPIHCQLAPQQ
jgi:hypothetical protein